MVNCKSRVYRLFDEVENSVLVCIIYFEITWLFAVGRNCSTCDQDVNICIALVSLKLCTARQEIPWIVVRALFDKYLRRLFQYLLVTSSAIQSLSIQLIYVFYIFYFDNFNHFAYGFLSVIEKQLKEKTLCQQNAANGMFYV